MKKMKRFTAIRKPHTPPGIPVIRCSSHGPPFTPWNTVEKQVEPMRMKITIAVSRMVISKARMMRSRRSVIWALRTSIQTMAA